MPRITCRCRPVLRFLNAYPSAVPRIPKEIHLGAKSPTLMVNLQTCPGHLFHPVSRKPFVCLSCFLDPHVPINQLLRPFAQLLSDGRGFSGSDYLDTEMGWAWHPSCNGYFDKFSSISPEPNVPVGGDSDSNEALPVASLTDKFKDLENMSGSKF